MIPNVIRGDTVRKNILRELIREGKPTLGTHANLDNPTIVELIGHSGMFDYVEFVAEYGPYDLHSLENLGRAIDLFPNFSGMIKVEQEPRTFITVRALGSGIQNLLYADIRTPADARTCVAAVRAEAPGSGGIHGVGMRRDAGYVLEGGSAAWITSLDEAVDLPDDREEGVRRGPRSRPRGPGHRHGPVRPVRLLDEHRRAEEQYQGGRHR